MSCSTNESRSAGVSVSRTTSSATDEEDDNGYSQISIFAKALEVIRQDYVDGTKTGYHDLVAAALKGMLSSLDPHTYKVVEHFPVGALPQHVTPSHDLKTLYVNDDVGNTLTPIDPLTGRPGKPFPAWDGSMPRTV